MSARRITFWRYNLLLESAALILTFAILLVAVWLTLADINRQYRDLRLADAASINLVRDRHLDDARQDLVRFTKLSATESSPRVLDLFDAFSDLYRLDQALHVERIDKAAPSSKVFIGFSFAGGKLGGALKSVGDLGNASDITRGYEDDAPSIYVAVRATGSEAREFT